MRNYLAVDIGASSGRHILGRVENGKIVLEEVFRFDNSQVRQEGHDCWDIDKLVAFVQTGIDEAMKKAEIDSIGIDTWGVDFVLLDENGDRCSDVVAYRDTRTVGADAEIERDVLSFADLYSRVGIQKTSFNTIYQLWALKKEHPEQLERAAHFLTVPEYLNYRLTGKIVHEYTDSSTTALLDVKKRDWDFELIEKLGLPTRIFGKLEMPGATVGEYKGVKVVLPALHDTGSAYLAVPARDERAVYLSSGTWSVLGVESDHPIISKAARLANFTNEGGAWARYRFLKNIMGLWIIQECKREWDRRADAVDFAGLVKLAEQAPAFKAVIDVDDPRFLAPGNMPARIQDYCRETNQPVPEGRGEISRVIYESLALKYRWAIERLEQDLLHKRIDVLHIVGGGSKNVMLNRMTAGAIRRPVIAGPGEGTVIGNLLVQAMALGEIKSIPELRQVVAASFENVEYLPEGDPAAWDEAYERLLKLAR